MKAIIIIGILIFLLLFIGAIAFISLPIIANMDINKENNTNSSQDIVTEENLDEETVSEVLSAFDTCEQKTFTFKQGNYTLEASITGQIGEKCTTIITLIDAPGLEAFLIGTNATCNLSKKEIETITISGDISSADCSGPLYDLANIK